MSEVMPCSAQKSSISWVSAMPPISEPAMAAALEDQVERRRARDADAAGTPTSTMRAVALQQRVKASRSCGAATVLRIRSKLPACCLHLVAVLRHHHFVGAQRLGVGDLVGRGGEGDDLCAPSAWASFTPIWPSPPMPTMPTFLPGPGLPMPQRRPGGDAGAEQRRDRGEVCLVMADVQHEMLVHHDRARIAAKVFSPPTRSGPL